MIVSWNWLGEYVRLDMPVEALAERLALTGLNHESTAEVGGDLAIDLEVTSNRPDCLGHLGIAREVAVVLGNRAATEPLARPVEAGPPVETATAVAVDEPGLCPQFTARVVRGLTIAPSPWWLRKRLETLGVRPINNVVDITNYVMFECGQPLHAYDLAKLAGHRLIVRRARDGESLKAINGRDYELKPSMLVIADAGRPVGLAGVMGGLDTEIGDATTDVLIEAARFDPLSIRRTGRALGLASPSSYRFERPMDPLRTEWASRRCAELILQLAGGDLGRGVIDIGPPPPDRSPIALRFAQIERVLGISIPRDRAIAILQDLGLARLDGDDDRSSFRPPSWRADLEREIDLIEEVARLHGYEHIPEDCAVPLAAAPRGRRERVEAETRQALAGMGLDEAITFSLVADDLVVPLDPGESLPPLRVEHSSRRRESALRPSLAPSLLEARARNEAHGTADAELFEIAQAYVPRDGRPLPDEPTRLAIVAGRDFLGLKGVVEALLDRFHVADRLAAAPVDRPPFAPGRAAALKLGDAHFGYLGEVALESLATFGLRGACSIAELEFDVLVDQADLVPRYRPLPSQPAVARDLSLVVPEALPWAELAEAARTAAGPSLESLRFLDTFRGPGIADGWHSLHFGLTFRRPDRTLTGDEADAAVAQVVAACAARFGASLRS